jgi:hypothetical protein
MLNAHFVHELEAGDVFLVKGFHKCAAQVPHPLGVALGGMDARFLPLVQPLHGRPVGSRQGSAQLVKGSVGHLA